MIMWRDSTSQQAQDDFDGLLNTSLEFVENAFNKRRLLAPFQVVVALDGKHHPQNVDPGEHVEPDALVDLHLETLRTQRHDIRAYALVFDVRLPEHGIDAVRIDLEHADGATIRVLIPYGFRRFTRRHFFLEMQVHERDCQVWNQ